MQRSEPAAERLHETGTKSSPSRLRFRPLSRPAFRFRVPLPGRASTYSRPVLGARGNLGHFQT